MKLPSKEKATSVAYPKNPEHFPQSMLHTWHSSEHEYCGV